MVHDGRYRVPTGRSALGQPHDASVVQDVAVDQLPHGYTNETTRTGQGVTKAYVGRHARERCTVERECLEVLRGRFPVPAVVEAATPEVLTMSFVPGSHGQDLIDAGAAELVLRLCGELLRELQGVAVDLLAGIPGDGDVLVHGDFGPQNLLIDIRVKRVTALLDWEFAHIGRSVEDLAWAEWIVRMHHSTWTSELDHLFEGFGARPAWDVRQSEMVHRCEQLVRFAEFQGWGAASTLWRERVQTAHRWVE